MSWVSKIVLAYIIVFLNSLCFADESYYLTLRNDKVNLRQGPSFDYPVKIVYEKKFLPILVLDKSDNWRKILDHEITLDGYIGHNYQRKRQHLIF